jgi:putative selenate reductase molybdopterin-binding subunit
MTHSVSNYRIPAFTDTPHSEVFFAETRDVLGPLGAKGMGECPINPVAGALANALANALADATGVHFRDPPVHPRSDLAPYLRASRGLMMRLRVR